MKIREDDTLIAASVSNGSQDIFLAKRNGKAIRFNEREIRPTGRGSTGVRGITVDKNDEVVGMVVVKNDASLLTVTEKGYGKRSQIDDYSVRHRGGKGIYNIKTTDRNGKVIAIKEVRDNDQLMLITRQGIVIRCPIAEMNVRGRVTQGVKLINVDTDDIVVDVAHLAQEDDE
jgi:DNA gyrase subunit A